jgi:putative N-acetylmannosamine-6-phosphate epimerase
LYQVIQKAINNHTKNLIIMTTLKTFTAWTRKANTNDQFCTQYIKAKNIKEAKALIIAEGREIETGTKIHLYA